METVVVEDVRMQQQSSVINQTLRTSHSRSKHTNDRTDSSFNPLAASSNSNSRDKTQSISTSSVSDDSLRVDPSPRSRHFSSISSDRSQVTNYSSSSLSSKDPHTLIGY